MADDCEALRERMGQMRLSDTRTDRRFFKKMFA